METQDTKPTSQSEEFTTPQASPIGMEAKLPSWKDRLPKLKPLSKIEYSARNKKQPKYSGFWKYFEEMERLGINESGLSKEWEERKLE